MIAYNALALPFLDQELISYRNGLMENGGPEKHDKICGKCQTFGDYWSCIFRSFIFSAPITFLLSLLFFFLLERPLQKVQGSVVSNRIGMKFGRNILHVNARRLTGRVFDLTFIVLRRRRWRHFTQWKVLPPGECTHILYQASTQQRPPVPDL